MTLDAIWLLGSAALLIVVAGLFSAAEAAISGFSRARADELVELRASGAKALAAILRDPARYLNTALLLRLMAETAAIVMVTLWVHDRMDGRFWPALLTTTGVMLVVSFVMVGVSPRTLGRQHERAALLLAPPLRAVTAVLGPVPPLLILVGNALTPGKGFDEGPFNSETELREMVDLAEASALIESSERKMLHSVFELGDTTVREVMVPRNDVVYVERHKNLRQTMSLFLRSGYSRVPVVGENLDDVIGVAYLKDVVQRDFDAPDVELVQAVEEVMRPVHFVPDSKPVDALLTELQARRQHIAMVVDEYGGVAGLVTIEDVLEEIVGEITDEYDDDEIEVVHLGDGTVRLSSRYPIDDLDEVVGIDVHEDDVDSVGGLMAKRLGRVPLPGAVVIAHGLRFEAEGVRGRRNKIDTVLVQALAPQPVEKNQPDDKQKTDKEESRND